MGVRGVRAVGVATKHLKLEYWTDPPRKAPTGFRTGKGAASANRREDV